MSAHVLAIRAADYAEQLSTAPFAGLPREEIERLHGSIDVLTLAAEQAAPGSGYLPLYTLTALHYNYSWLTFGAVSRGLGIVQPLVANGEAPPFLDRAYQKRAEQAVDAQLALPECEWRLAGLLHDTRLTLVYVARLRRPFREAALRDGTPLRTCGNGDLGLARADFDARSQLLIDHLQAL